MCEINNCKLNDLPSLNKEFIIIIITFQMNNKFYLIQCITKWIIVDQRKSEIQQLKEGLNYMGFLDAIKYNALFERLFVFTERYSITAKYMKEKLGPSIEKMVIESDDQKKAMEFAKQYIDSLNGKLRISIMACIYKNTVGPLHLTLSPAYHDYSIIIKRIHQLWSIIFYAVFDISVLPF